jgi:hypothetical protein
MSALGLALTIGLIACTDTTGPNDTPFSPVGAAADLLVVDGAFDSDIFVSLAESSTIFNSINGGPLPSAALIDAGWSLALADGPWEVEQAGRRLARAVSASSAGLTLIPQDFLGRTYEHGVEGYYWNNDRIGAPDNGVRFILYEVNPVTHDIGGTEIGYVDVIDESTDLSRIARVIVVSGEVEHINYTVSATLGTNSAGFAVSGFFGDGTDQVQIDLSMGFVNTDLTSTVTVDYVIEVVSRGFLMDATLVMVHDRETQMGSATIEVTFQQNGHAVQMTGDIGDLDEGENGSIEILVDAQPFATVTFTGDSVTVVGHDGEPLSADHAAAVRSMFHGIEDLFNDKFEDFVRPVSWLFNF